ncbi:hypothetical protein VNO77_09140 [Canavalia gladiata]|uniref:Uncharacterized protein n=1 Tax=Canavalia gladiata TaxID=3824 RepID=A0AAN9QX92_CANGL
MGTGRASLSEVMIVVDLKVAAIANGKVLTLDVYEVNSLLDVAHGSPKARYDLWCGDDPWASEVFGTSGACFSIVDGHTR